MGRCTLKRLLPAPWRDLDADPSVTPWSEGDLATGDNTIHYYRIGREGAPAVVLLHGFGDAGLCWLPLAFDLADQFDVVMVDAPGHGKSGTGPRPERIREQAVSDLLHVIHALALREPALVGHSLGAATAATVAATNREIRCVVLEDPRWLVAPEQPAPLEPMGIAQVRSFKMLRADQLAAVAATERSGWTPLDRQTWADAKLSFNLKVLSHGPISPLPSWRHQVQAIESPVLLVTADPDRGAFVTTQVAEEAAHLARNVTVAHIPGAGHNIRRERYEPYREAVISFLAATLPGLLVATS